MKNERNTLYGPFSSMKGTSRYRLYSSIHNGEEYRITIPANLFEIKEYCELKSISIKPIEFNGFQLIEISLIEFNQYKEWFQNKYFISYGV